MLLSVRKIVDLLVADGIILVPKNLKLPPLEQRKKRGFCKFHGFLGHNLSCCTRFRDFVQKALDEGRQKFRDKSKHIPQIENQEANDLTQIASGYKVSKEKFQELIEIKEKRGSREAPSKKLLIPNLGEQKHWTIKHKVRTMSKFLLLTI